MVLPHAHVDHAGYLPRLCQAGYAGPVYGTRGTRDLLPLLPDAGPHPPAAAADRHA